MSKILFVNGNLHGHINPTLPIVKELVHRGEEVYYFSTKEFQPKIEATGAVFMDYGDQFDQFLHTFRPNGTHPFYTLMEFMLALDLTVIPIILDKTKAMRFDYIIHDVMFGGGSILAHRLNLPAISSCSSFVMVSPPIPERMLAPGFHPQLDTLLTQLENAANEWGLASLQISDIFFKREALNLVYTSRLFQPQGESYDNTYRFVGPSITNRKESLDFSLEIPAGKKIIYITLGTVLNNKIDFYNKCIDAFWDTPYQVILSIGNKTEISRLNPIPKNFVIRSYVPQLEVLKHTDLLISHGGLNSVSEALYYGVPIIVIPLANDQPAVAKRITELGAGLELKLEEITSEVLRTAARTVLSERSYRECSAAISHSFIQAGGYHKAVDEIFDYINSFT